MTRLNASLMLAWLAWTLAGALLLAHARLNRLDDAFQTDARIVHRLLSQTAVQHDAVLNTLTLLQPAAVGVGSPEARLPTLFPQILAVRRRGSDAPWSDAALEQAEEQSRVRQRAVLADVDLPHGRYTLVRAGRPASYALTIGLATLASGDDWPMDATSSPVRVTLEQGAAQYVLQPGAHDVDARNGWPLDFRKTLGSQSQTLDVVAHQRVGWADLPWPAMLAWSTLGALLAWAWASWQRQRTARQRAEALLRLDQVARLNTLGELAAGIAHELNQPLTAVLAATQASLRLLAEDEPELPTTRQAMQQAVAQARRAAEVLARLRRSIEAPGGQAATVVPASVDLVNAARRALALLQPDMEQAGVTLSWQASGPVRAQADPVALDQILHNLLGNALHALAQVPVGERRLTVRAQTQGNRALLSVADTGCGITPDQMAHLFEPFFTTRAGGLGLGLSLCETLAASQGGSLDAAHNPPRGAVFTLSRPAA